MRSSERNALVLQHRYLARRAAVAVKRRVPDWVEIEDLEQWAYTGLVRAARQYRPRMGVPFAAYAWPIVKGAVWDRYRRREYEQEVRLPRARVNGEIRSVAPCDIDRMIDEENAERELADALNALPDRERQVIWMYFYEGRSLRSAGRALSVNESRACQLKQRALRILREMLTARLGQNGRWPANRDGKRSC